MALRPQSTAFTFLIDAYREEVVRDEKRVVLGLHPELAPYKVAVLPLLKKRDDLVALAHKIRNGLSREFTAVYDDTAAIGKLYRRQDEIGTPWCVTIDFDTIEKRQRYNCEKWPITIRKPVRLF